MPATRPVPLWQLLSIDPDHAMADMLEQLGQLSARLVLLRLALYRCGNHETVDARLERLATSLREATEDVRAAQQARATRR